MQDSGLSYFAPIMRLLVYKNITIRVDDWWLKEKEIVDANYVCIGIIVMLQCLR